MTDTVSLEPDYIKLADSNDNPPFLSTSLAGYKLQPLPKTDTEIFRPIPTIYQFSPEFYGALELAYDKLDNILLAVSAVSRSAQDLCNHLLDWIPDENQSWKLLPGLTALCNLEYKMKSSIRVNLSSRKIPEDPYIRISDVSGYLTLNRLSWAVDVVRYLLRETPEEEDSMTMECFDRATGYYYSTSSSDITCVTHIHDYSCPVFYYRKGGKTSDLVWALEEAVAELVDHWMPHNMVPTDEKL
ncbi:hypothetical protein BZA77DRAFT_318796 [Pyronema omphalodes]|nr:hypothetical protein BZA77DRAFT_318796 [Pyronema omphalodes]